MGRVWVAREQGITIRPRLVAIKTALAEEAASEDYWKVLLDEARIASQLQHPNVCSIHALDRERGVVYLVMDWSDGGSLRELLDVLPEGRLEYPLAARLVAKVGAGLHAAHELVGEDGTPLHVVHRDVSPQNILLSSSGQVKITDFGVAKARGQLHAPTQTGEVKGKLSYMAPEQVTTRDVDRRADVFALGCVLYEASTGLRPFKGDDALSTLYQLLEQPIVPPSSRKSDYPPGLERITLKALERDPEKRYQTTEEMARALDMWLASERALVSDSDLATVIATALGDRIRERVEAVQAAQIACDAPESEAAIEGAQRPIETLSGSATNTVSNTVVTPHPGRRYLWPLVAAAGVALALGVVMTRREPAAPPPANPIRAAVPAEAKRSENTPAEAPSVAVTLRSDPPGAELYLDDGPAAGSPYLARAAGGSSPHKVRAKLAGFADLEQDVMFDRDKEVVLHLRALPGATSAAPSPKRVAWNRSPVTGNTPATPTENNPPPANTGRQALGELPAVVRKPPRTLDSDNPFER